MFGFGKKKMTSAEGKQLLVDIAHYQFETDDMLAAARSSERNIAILKPQIPIGSGPSAGWFGGNAALPEGMAWPEENGQKLLFVGQIDLSALPNDIWSGAGPRSGWLGIFLPEKGAMRPTILHFQGPLTEVKAPLPNNADWTRIHNFKEPQTFALPKWPLVVEVRRGNEIHVTSALGSEKKPEPSTLLDPSYHPFNRETVSLLLAALGEAVTRLAREIVRFPAMKKLRPDDAAWFERQRPIMLNTFTRFFEIEGQMRAAGELSAPRIANFIGEIAKLDAYDQQYPRTDEEGFCELILREVKLLEWQPDRSDLRRWWTQYEAHFTNHAIKDYTSNPTALPQPVRERLEIAWKDETRDGLGAMGHAPKGHIYEPIGPNSPNEVLLEINTSKLVGWIWGDCYSLVLVIDRAALKRGDFSQVNAHFTN